jgi:hypothetical protein
MENNEEVVKKYGIANFPLYRKDKSPKNNDSSSDTVNASFSDTESDED